ncbi:MAG TPA: hypothetical protein VF252_02590 [Gemmatimonadales bacterium]
MHAGILKAFFLGQATATELSRDLDVIWEPSGSRSRSRRFVFEDLDEDFEIYPDHLVRVCDAVLAGEIEAPKLEGVGAALFTSDHFTWGEEGAEAERVAQTVSDWVDPEINFDLNLETTQKFRHRLLTGEHLFTPADWWMSVHRPA